LDLLDEFGFAHATTTCEDEANVLVVFVFLLLLSGFLSS
jgi:hypothetical protein